MKSVGTISDILLCGELHEKHLSMVSSVGSLLQICSSSKQEDLSTELNRESHDTILLNLEHFVMHMHNKNEDVITIKKNVTEQEKVLKKIKKS